MDEVPQLQGGLGSIRGYRDVLDDLWCELMSSTAPKGGKSKLCIGIHRRSLHKTLFRVKELANDRIVPTRLPFLNGREFQTSIARPVCM